MKSLCIVNALGRFQEDNDQSPGIGLYQFDVRQRNTWPDADVFLVECNASPALTARRVLDTHAEIIAVAAYSHGDGEFFPDFARELTARHRRICLWLAIDPVFYTPWYQNPFGFLFDAFTHTEKPFPVPGNVDAVIAARSILGDGPWGHRVDDPRVLRQYIYGTYATLPRKFKPYTSTIDLEYIWREVSHGEMDNQLEPQDDFMDVIGAMR